MNIVFKSVDIEHFRSIEKAFVPLSNQGIVIVRGINEYEDKATSNGSGKSSIFEAIVFALFEETSGGEKTVSNRITGQGYSIKLDFDVDNNHYTILRQCSGSKSNVTLYKNDVDISARNKTDTNKLIESILGISKSLFLDSVFLSQSISTNLASLSPTARKERLEVLTNTDQLINDFKEKLKQRQLDYENKRVELQLEQNKLNGNKEALLNQINNLQLKLQEIEYKIQQRDQLGNIDTINNEIDTANKNIEIQKYDLQQKDIEIENCEQEIKEFRNTGNDDITLKDKLVADINSKLSEIQKQNNEINMLEYEINQSNTIINRENFEIDKVKNSDTCPTCGRKYENVNEDHINNIINEHQNNISNELDKQKQLQDKMEITKGLIENLTQEQAAIQNELNNVNIKINQFNDILNQKEDKRRRLTSERQIITNNILQINNQIQSLQGKKEQILSFDVGNKDEVIKMQQDVQNQINEIDDKVKTYEDKLTENNNYIESIKHSLQLVTKDFRTYLLQNSIQYLNQQLLKYSNQLFSNSKDMIQISDNDTKLDIKLGQAPYESLSGGEKTRVNIALLLAQKSLASIVGNITCNMIILDEILGYCDAEAETNVVNLITLELNTLESIFMISHKEIPIGYDTELTVIKNKDGLTSIKTY